MSKIPPKAIKPKYSKTRVDNAGKKIRNFEFTHEDLLVTENWRSSHHRILNSWQAILRRRLKYKFAEMSVTFAQRLKRKKTILNKLERLPTMKLSRMQDIAGCRLIFEDLEQLQEFRNDLIIARMDHKLIKTTDYITDPKNSGYRGIHDIYEFRNRPNRDQSWNGLQIEIQYRTYVQHAWATAVEVAGSITGHLSKFSEGDERQIAFFRLCSEILSRAYEQSTSCLSTLTNPALLDLFQSAESEMGLLAKLKSLRALGKHEITSTAPYTIIIYSDTDTKPEICSLTDLDVAIEKYFKLEKDYKDKDIVLVWGFDRQNIRKAYQNYFSDTKDFVKYMEDGINKLKSSS